ncbi:MAG TPA: hypothetical protein VFX58_04770 [Chitinophagaceae bacterium]|nr:hypothetical protein [Chitinophagaceae bacterium]
MFSKWTRKNRRTIYILMLVAFTGSSIINAIDYVSPEGKNWDLASAIVHGILALIMAGNLWDQGRRKKAEERQSQVQ